MPLYYVPTRVCSDKMYSRSVALESVYSDDLVQRIVFRNHSPEARLNPEGAIPLNS